jgi:hypothetical protein
MENLKYRELGPVMQHDFLFFAASFQSWLTSVYFRISQDNNRLLFGRQCKIQKRQSMSSGRVNFTYFPHPHVTRKMSFYTLQCHFTDEKNCIDYLENYHVFYQSYSYPNCGTNMARNLSRNCFRCPKHTCRRELNLRVGMFFFNSRLFCHQILVMA